MLVQRVTSTAKDIPREARWINYGVSCRIPGRFLEVYYSYVLFASMRLSGDQPWL